MKRMFAPFMAVALVTGAVPASAIAQPTSAAQADPAKLAEAHAIIAIMFPPAQREQMMDKLQNDVVAQFRTTIPSSMTSDPGMKALMDAYIAEGLKRQRPIMLKHQPMLLEAMARAYTHEFSLAELKDIRAFAQTPSGTHYLSRSTAIIGDPDVAKANIDMIAEVHSLTETMKPELKAKLMDYLKAHPDVARKIVADAQAQR